MLQGFLVMLREGNDYWHIITEEWSPEGEYGTYMTLAMLATPFLYLLGAKRATMASRV